MNTEHSKTYLAFLLKKTDSAERQNKIVIKVSRRGTIKVTLDMKSRCNMPFGTCFLLLTLHYFAFCFWCFKEMDVHFIPYKNDAF